MNPRRVYSAAFKRKVVQEALTTQRSQAEIEREYGIGAGCLCRWLREQRQATQTAQAASEAFPGHGKQASAAAELAAMQRELELAQAQVAILKKALQIVSQPHMSAI